MKSSNQFSLDNLYKQTIESMLVHIYWKDINFRYLYCNLLQANDIGFSSPEEVIGKSDYDLYPKKQADQLRKNDLHVIRTGLPCIFEEEAADLRRENAVYLTQKIPLINERGEIIGITGISFDISARQDAEEKIRLEKDKAEAALAIIIENLPGHVYWKDENFVYQGCNYAQAQSAGLANPSEIIGKTDYEMPWKKEAHILRASDVAVMQSKKTLTYEEASQLANSNMVSLFLSKKTPLFDRAGNAIGILGISFDITDRKKMEEALRQAKEIAEAANRAKTEFIANMSHDIRTPLAGIISMSRLLEEKEQEVEKKQFTHWLLESGEQLLDLLNGVLDVVSSDNLSEQDIREECFSLRQNIEAIGKLEMPAIKTKGLDLQIAIDEKIPLYIVTDRLKLHRILLNLLGNAIKFTKEGHVALKVTLLAKNEQVAQLAFSVIDTGIGIPPELQSKVFERFYRVNPAYKGQYRGHGVGLNIAQKYAALLGGELKLTSEVGKGTTFSFALPLKIGNKKDAKTLSTQEIQEIANSENKKLEPVSLELPFTSPQTIASSESPNILLIEDSAMALRVAEIVANKAGCRFHSVRDAEQALELVKSKEFDLVITDIGLPGMSGIDLVHGIREWEKETSSSELLPIIGLTAHAKGSKIEQDCLSAGMNKVLEKPLDLSDLKNVLKQFIIADQNLSTQEKIIGKETIADDLPANEKELFALEQYPLLDISEAFKILSNENTVKEILQQMIDTSLSSDKEKLKHAFAENNWKSIEKLAHKIKGGAVYCGTIRLHYACQYLERYRKAGHIVLLEKLYQQLLTVLEDTEQALNSWLGTKD